MKLTELTEHDLLEAMDEAGNYQDHMLRRKFVRLQHHHDKVVGAEYRFWYIGESSKIEEGRLMVSFNDRGSLIADHLSV